jgi:hypothetical protein
LAVIMRNWPKCLLTSLGLLVLATAAFPADLSMIDRRVAKEPTYPAAPEYCLLVFGPSATERLWLVVAGDSVYFDRNGNGDLTDPAKKQQLGRYRHGDRHVSRSRLINLGDFEIGTLKHKDLILTQSELRTDFVPEVFLQQALVRFLPTKPGVRVYSITLDVEMHLISPGGVPVSGRFAMSADTDDQGFLAFASRAGDAPIVGFDSDFGMALYGKPALEAGKETSLAAMVGRRGVGSGTFASLPCAIISDQVDPMAVLEFPSRLSNAPIRVSVRLSERC